MAAAESDSSDGRYDRCLIGGTFDHLHSGHEHLLDTAFSRCVHVELWLTDDAMASSKRGWVQSWEQRRDALAGWIGDNSLDRRASIHCLSDEDGPAGTREDCDAMICTPETRKGCERINRMRISAGLAELAIILVDHVLGANGEIVSSSRVRAGAIDRQGHSWLDHRCIDTDLIMPASADEGLKQPLGELYIGPEDVPTIAMSAAIAHLPQRAGRLVAVGDVCVEALRSLEIVPDIAVVDGRTKRIELPVEELTSLEGYDTILHCSNPAGRITPDLAAVLMAAAASKGTVLVQVDGEEDLAPMILHAILELDAFVFYGQPGEGVVMCRSSEYAKDRCRSRLSQFTQSRD